MSGPLAPSPAYLALTRVTVTGPESTGKTTLARDLADHFGTSWVPEAARTYAERRRGQLRADDVEPIAQEHVIEAERATAGASRLLVLDTDLLSTVIYARHYYGVVPPAVERAEERRRSHLYLLCDVDVPWLPDGIRDRPANREEMLVLFRDALDERGLRTKMIRGGWPERWELARSAVADLLRRTAPKS